MSIKKKPVVAIEQNGNAFAIMATVRKALKKAGYTDQEIQQYTDAAKSGDYDNLLQVSMQWVDFQSSSTMERLDFV